jgi:hypothetical protein
MSLALAEPPMARRTDATAKIDVEVLRKARVVASFKGLTLAEYLSETLEPIVDRQLKEEMDAEAKRTRPKR